jgi:hypothetical protein
MRNILAIIISAILLIGVGCSTTQNAQQPTKDIEVCSLEITHPDILACIRDVSTEALKAQSNISFDEIVCVCKYKWIKENMPGLINER